MWKNMRYAHFGEKCGNKRYAAIAYSHKTDMHQWLVISGTRVKSVDLD